MTSIDLDRQVERFLFHEARLLDDRRYGEWLDLWGEDARYVLPASWSENERGLVSAAPGELHHLEDSKPLLAMRVGKLLHGSAWAESPPSRTARLVTNVIAESDGDAIAARSTFLLIRSRYTGDLETYAGARHDRIRVSDDGWRLTERVVILATGALQVANLEVLF